MISEPRFSFVPNVACSNDTLCLAVSATLGLAAAVWTTPRSNGIETTRHESLGDAIERLLLVYPRLQTWLLAGHRIDQPDTRITRHLRLWSSLQRRGLELPTGQPIEERCVEGESGLRFFGAVPLDLVDLGKALSIITQESGAIVAVYEEVAGRLAAAAIAKGWPECSTTPPEAILEAVCLTGGFVVNVYGEFDDPSVIAAIFGKRDSVKGLADRFAPGSVD